jgi:alpha-methylacyl-CoA racemase
MAAAAATSGEPGDDSFVMATFSGLGQEAAAQNAASAIMAALVAVGNGGEGVWIDISCWDSAVDANRAAISYLASTGITVQDGFPEVWGSMQRIYRSKDDKKVFIAVIEKKFWDIFCDAIDRNDLRTLWDGEEGGVDYGDMKYRGVIADIMASRTAEEWLALFMQTGLPGSPVLELSDVLDSDHFRTRGLLDPIDGEAIVNVASPIRWIDQPGERPGIHPRPAPGVGQHNEEVLSSWLGDGEAWG